MVLEAFFKDLASAGEGFRLDKKFQAEIAEINWQTKKIPSEKIILAKPQTYMNNSGLSASLISKFYKVNPEDIWVIHDEIDLPLGAMKIRLGGSSAGHKGVESVIESLGSAMFWRFRLGIGPQHSKIPGKKIKPIDDFVLGTFSENEMGKQREIIKKAKKAIASSMEDGLQKAMNKFNTK